MRRVWRQEAAHTDQERYRAWLVYGTQQLPYRDGQLLTWAELCDARSAYGSTLHYELVTTQEARQCN